MSTPLSTCGPLCALGRPGAVRILHAPLLLHGRRLPGRRRPQRVLRCQGPVYWHARGRHGRRVASLPEAVQGGLASAHRLLLRRQ